MEHKNRNIEIFNTSYKVKFVDDIKSENPDVTIWGETDYINRTITVRVKNSDGSARIKEEIDKTYLHELVHVIFGEGAYHVQTSDELLVEWTARCIKSLIDQKVIK